MKISEKLDNFNIYEKIAHIERNGKNEVYLWFLFDAQNNLENVNVEFTPNKLIVKKKGNANILA